LLRDPFCRRLCCHIEPDKLSTSQPDNDQNVEQVEANRRDHEQIHSCDVQRMVAQEGAPTLADRVTFLGHVLGDGRLSHRDAELEKFAMNPRTSQLKRQWSPSQVGRSLWRVRGG